MKNPRINVTLNADDLHLMQLLSEKKKLSISSLAKKMIEDWLEEYEDMQLSRRADELEKKWIEEGSETISHEDLCLELVIKSNIQKNPLTTSKSSPKTSKKESSGLSKKGSPTRRKKLVKTF